MINPWLQFALAAAVIVYAGTRLTGSAAVIARNTRIGTAWAGAALLPLATSLPELVTTVRAATIGSPDLATGNILGSCLFNLALLALIDAFEGRGLLSSMLGKGHLLMASLGIIALNISLIGILEPIKLSLGPLGLDTILIAVLYLAGSRLVFNLELVKPAEIESRKVPSEKPALSTARGLFHFVISAGFIFLAGIFLTDAADRIAMEGALGYSFVGTLFLAVSTSLPETVTTISAVVMGFPGMAVANIFGANLMNLFILFLADLFFSGGPLLAASSKINLFSASMAAIFTSLAVCAALIQPKKGLGRLGFENVIITAGYIATIYLIYQAGLY